MCVLLKSCTFLIPQNHFRRQFEIAFRMFDLNGDGDVDAEEFEQVEVNKSQNRNTHFCDL